MGRRKKMWSIIIIFPLLYLFSTSYTVQKICKSLLSNWLSKILVDVHHEYYIVNYPYGMEWYKIKIPRNRNPQVILSMNSEGKDVYKEITPFMGPGLNFHGIPTTPENFGLNSLTIETLENLYNYEMDDEINFNYK